MPLFGGRRELARDDLAENRLSRAPQVRRVADQHLVENYPERVDVRRSTDRLVTVACSGLM